MNKEAIMFEEHELNIINRALSLLLSNYNEDDLYHLEYSEIELEAEIGDLFEKIGKVSK